MEQRNLLREIMGVVLTMDPPGVHCPVFPQKQRPRSRWVLVSPAWFELGSVRRQLSLTLSALSFSTPYLPPKPLAASVWEECFSTSATYSWPRALWDKSRMERVTREKWPWKSKTSLRRDGHKNVRNPILGQTRGPYQRCRGTRDGRARTEALHIRFSFNTPRNPSFRGLPSDGQGLEGQRLGRQSSVKPGTKGQWKQKTLCTDIEMRVVTRETRGDWPEAMARIEYFTKTASTFILDFCSCLTIKVQKCSWALIFNSDWLTISKGGSSQYCNLNSISLNLFYSSLLLTPCTILFSVWFWKVHLF